MGILAVAADERVADVETTEDELSVRLMDGRTISVPLVWYPRLLHATQEQRKKWQIAGSGFAVPLITFGWAMPTSPLPHTNITDVDIALAAQIDQIC